MTEKLLAKKRLAFLTDTINFYTSLNRGVGPLLSCVYAPSVNHPGCAIGRHIPKKLAIELDKIASSVCNEQIFCKLPKKLTNLGKGFLVDIQKLHDEGSHWNSMGLSKTGKIRVENIKRDYNLN